jgi:hypothetical protein
MNDNAKSASVMQWNVGTRPEEVIVSAGPEVQGATRPISSELAESLFERRLDSDRRDVCRAIWLQMGDQLKLLLEQDERDVKVDGVLAPLPVSSRHSVKQILIDYEKHELNRMSGVMTTDAPRSPMSSAHSPPPFLYSKQTLSEFVNSIEIYFNTLLQRNYLFHNDLERSQFVHFRSDRGRDWGESIDGSWIDCFGLIHLLRLIVVLPDFLAVCSMSKGKMSQLVQCICHFTQYLHDHLNHYLIHAD